MNCQCVATEILQSQSKKSPTVFFVSGFVNQTLPIFSKLWWSLKDLTSLSTRCRWYHWRPLPLFQ